MTIETAVDYSILRGKGGTFKTTALFWERRSLNPVFATPVYNLSKEDHNETLSMYNIYMSYETEYDAAMFILGDWKHWEVLCGCTFFKKHITCWREERAVKEAAIAHRVLLEAARSGNVAAARTILLDARKVEKAGRPSNRSVEKAANHAADLDAFLVQSIMKVK